MPIATKGSSLEVSNLKVLKNLACKIANKIKSGETILLYGQLGVGKTTFARFFINRLQKKTNSKITEVPSHTFTVSFKFRYFRNLGTEPSSDREPLESTLSDILKNSVVRQVQSRIPRVLRRLF